MRKKVLGVILVVFFLVASTIIQPAVGQEFPTEPIQIISPFPAGSSSDLMSRFIADIAPKYLGHPLIVVNKPGASGSIAASEVVNSKPGSKIFPVSQFFLATTIKTQKVPFGPNDLIPLGSFMEYRLGLAVKGDSQWKTFDDLLDYARKNPGKLTWSHSGRASSVHMAGLLVFRKAGVKTVDMPSRGSPKRLASLLGGHVDASTFPFGAIKDHVEAGKIRYLVVFSGQRFSELSNVPCTTELGFPEVAKLATILGMYTHRDTPDKLKQALIEACRKTCEDPEFKKGIEEKMGEELKCGGPESVREAIKEAEEVGVPIIKELGLYVGK